ncbi:MAG: DUF4020 domain-containing protein [Acidimicrobiia bacterium]|nr:DUF4020 domain-containing protein [Acidimicrobiia bacterium]MYG70909.1 DUF4020 domain-containing protein [Acidimicrobiia bacterium]
MRLDGARIPAGLVKAFNEGRLALFTGAGVSKGDPSCVPLLDELTDRVAAELGVSSGPDKDGGAASTPVDRLGQYASAGLGVHEAVLKIVSQSAEPNDTHRSVCDLARAMGAVRIVTTNYDRHLSACLPGGTRVYEAPDFPGDGDFAGVVHLHGSIAQEPGRLVVTEADFARSYMQWNSPTLSFLHRLFASKTVLFIGYSLDDILMRYILRATETRTGIYALTRNPDSPQWAELGIEAVGYQSHDDLPGLLAEWAERSAGRVEYHDRRVSRITAETSTIEDLSALDASYLADLIADPDWVRIFTNHARGPVWLRWAATRPDAKIFAPKAELGAADKPLADWFIAHHNYDEKSAAETLRLIVENDGCLHETLWLNMAMDYDPRGGATRETGNRLMLALADTAPPIAGRGACLLNLLNSCATPDDDSLFLELVDRAFAPTLTAPNSLHVYFGEHGPYQTAVADPADGWLHETVDKDYWSQRRHLAADLLAIIDGHLRRVIRIEEVAGNPDPYYARSAIEAHDQDRGFGDKGFLVDAARDLIELLIDGDPQAAAGHLASWSASGQPILNRLAIHCWAYRHDVSAEAKIGWLLGQEGWATDTEMHHEVAMLAAAASREDESAIGPLVAQILSDPGDSDPQIVLDMLGWIARRAPSSEAARQAFQQAQDANPGMEMSEHPEFPWWNSVFAGPVPPAGGMTAEEITTLVADDPGEAAERLLAVAVAADSPDSSKRDWFATHSACQEAVRLSPETGLALLDAVADRAARHPEPSREVAAGILAQLTNHATVRETARDHRDKLELLLAKLWDAGNAHWECPPTHSPWQGWAQETINSWPGALVALCIHKATAQKAGDPQAWAGLPEPDRRFLEAAIGGDTDAAKLAQAACADKLVILHDADREWASNRLLPLMDPAEDADRALRFWDAYLPSRRWSPELLEDGLLGHLEGFCGHADQCSGIARRGFARLAADLCLHADLEAVSGTLQWLRQFTTRASEAIRTEFIRSVFLMLLDQDPEAKAAQWHRWMCGYWQARIGGLPRPLDAAEASDLADWCILLDSDFPVAIAMSHQSRASLQEDSMLPAEMHRAARGSGRCIHLLEQHPGTLARHVSNLIANTDRKILHRIDISLTVLIRQLNDRTDEVDFQPLREQALQLGWGHAVQ